MAFDRVPSQLGPLFWTVTYHDIQTRLRLFVGEKQLAINQHFQVMSQVVNQAFGGGESKADSAAIPQSGAQAMSMFKGLNL